MNRKIVGELTNPLPGGRKGISGISRGGDLPRSKIIIPMFLCLCMYVNEASLLSGGIQGSAHERHLMQWVVVEGVCWA